ncbi:carboxypeptidase regulatory-like domain-containing protein [bacterium]|nr:carboxypeptidase regulatory-like domain-containing protein [bacterium]
MMRTSAWGLVLGAVLGLAGCGWLDGFHGYQGKVVDANGKPLAGVAIASGRAATLSGEDGSFSLADSRGGVTFRKVRYQAREVDPGAGASVVLKASEQPVSVVWDERWQSPAMNGVITYLQGKGFSIQRVRQGELPTGREVYVLPSPAWFNQEAYQAYLRLASEGAKLLVLGEWGGYDGVDFDACNSLASQAGISFVPAAVRVYGTGIGGAGMPDEWLTLRRFESASLASGLSQGIRLFTAGVLEVKDPARALLRTGEDAFRIQAWSGGPQIVAAAGPLGRGSLVALSDTSLFTDENAPDGTAHHRVLDNQAFAVNLLEY